MRFRHLLTGPLGRLLLTALAIAAMAVVTRGLRTLIEQDALAVFAESDSAEVPAPRLIVEIDAPERVSNIVLPVKPDREGAAFSRASRAWLCVPASVKPMSSAEGTLEI